MINEKNTNGYEEFEDEKRYPIVIFPANYLAIDLKEPTVKSYYKKVLPSPPTYKSSSIEDWALFLLRSPFLTAAGLFVLSPLIHLLKYLGYYEPKSYSDGFVIFMFFVPGFCYFIFYNIYKQILFLKEKKQYNKILKMYEKLQEKLKSPNIISDFREKLKREFLLNSTNMIESNVIGLKVGVSERKFTKSLIFNFGKHISTNKTLDTSCFKDWSPNYVCDFVFYDETTGLKIDIEIDEPYIGGTLTPIHYLGVDENRNNFFSQNGWFIIRFTEKQVVSNPDGCCKVVADLIKDVTKKESYSNKLKKHKDLVPVPQWTAEQAILKAKQKYRESYLGIEFNQKVTLGKIV